MKSWKRELLAVSTRNADIKILFRTRQITCHHITSGTRKRNLPSTLHSARNHCDTEQNSTNKKIQKWVVLLLEILPTSVAKHIYRAAQVPHIRNRSQKIAVTEPSLLSTHTDRA